MLILSSVMSSVERISPSATGIMAPAFMNTGTLSSGASAKIYLPPLYFSPL